MNNVKKRKISWTRIVALVLIAGFFMSLAYAVIASLAFGS